MILYNKEQLDSFKGTYRSYKMLMLAAKACQDFHLLLHYYRSAQHQLDILLEVYERMEAPTVSYEISLTEYIKEAA